MAAADARSGPPLLGLTGGIAAGKSAALEAFRELGAQTLSTDEVVRELLGTDEVRDLVVERYGTEAAPAGQVDRDAVARIVFADPEQRQWLEGVLWPRVGARMAEWAQEVRSMDPAPPAGVVEVPLLFESNMEDAFDATVVVVVDESVRAERAGGRGHEAVEERAAAQLSQEEKAGRADHVIHNDGTLADLKAELAALLERLSPA
jgi:dephospho-CoA kinase